MGALAGSRGAAYEEAEEQELQDKEEDHQDKA